jgi:hypothetical protein
MFFEVADRGTRKGQMGLATSKEGLEWNYKHIVAILRVKIILGWRRNWINPSARL